MKWPRCQSSFERLQKKETAFSRDGGKSMNHGIPNGETGKAILGSGAPLSGVGAKKRGTENLYLFIAHKPENKKSGAPTDVGPPVGLQPMGSGLLRGDSAAHLDRDGRRARRSRVLGDLAGRRVLRER